MFWLKLIHEWLRCVALFPRRLVHFPGRALKVGWALFLTVNLTLVCLWAISRSTFPRRRPKPSESESGWIVGEADWSWDWLVVRDSMLSFGSFVGWIFLHVKIKSGLSHFVFIGVVRLMVEDKLHSLGVCWLEWMMTSAVLHYNYNFIIAFRLKQNDSIPIAWQTFYFRYVSGRLRVKPH